MDQGTHATRLRRIHDELKERAHLAALEARAAWDRAHLERIGDELASLRDEARVQTHLGAMDARDAWARLDHELHTLAQKTGSAADEAVSRLTRAAKEILGERTEGA